MENYKPHIGDMVWVEGKNPESYAIMPTLAKWREKGWIGHDSRPNAEVIDLVSGDCAIVKYFNGSGIDSFDLDFFSVKEDHVWKIREDTL